MSIFFVYKYFLLIIQDMCPNDLGLRATKPVATTIYEGGEFTIDDVGQDVCTKFGCRDAKDIVVFYAGILGFYSFRGFVTY